jgi:hypothetical protein
MSKNTLSKQGDEKAPDKAPAKKEAYRAKYDQQWLFKKDGSKQLFVGRETIENAVNNGDWQTKPPRDAMGHLIRGPLIGAQEAEFSNSYAESMHANKALAKENKDLAEQLRKATDENKELKAQLKKLRE